MKNIKEIIKISNMMYKREIRKLMRNIIANNMLEESKNNLCIAGELIIENLKLLEHNKTMIALSSLRNIYESTLKGIVFDKNSDIRDSYNKIEKDKDDDGMKNVRYIIGNDYNNYFRVIENDPRIKNYFDKGILTYIYDNLCKFSHCTKVNEIVYLLQKENQLKEIFDIYITLFLIYPIILLYMDAICTKLDIKNTIEEMVLIYSITLLNILIILINYKDIVNEMNNFFKGKIDFSNQLLFNKIEKEKEFVEQCSKEINVELERTKSSKIDVINIECIFKRYFSNKELEIYNYNIIKGKSITGSKV